MNCARAGGIEILRRARNDWNCDLRHFDVQDLPVGNKPDDSPGALKVGLNGAPIGLCRAGAA